MCQLPWCLFMFENRISINFDPIAYMLTPAIFFQISESLDKKPVAMVRFIFVIFMAIKL